MTKRIFRLLNRKVPKKWCRYTKEPEDGMAYTHKMDLMYTTVVRAYDGFIKHAPFWGLWLESVLPYVQGERILEVAFGPAYLLTKYPSDMKVYGLDYNRQMVRRAKAKVLMAGGKAKLIQGHVAEMPYMDAFFDTLVVTMAFSGFPEGDKALSEMLRVLKPGGRLILLDYDYPRDRNVAGFLVVRFIEACGDIMRDIGQLIENEGCTYERRVMGAWGSVQLFIVEKN